MDAVYIPIYEPSETEENLPYGGGPSVEMTDTDLQEVPPGSYEESEKLQQTPDEKVNGGTLSECAAPVNRIGSQEPLVGRSRGWSIFRVPAHVRKVENEAYTPKIVSIGPIHHNDQPSLTAFENQKLRFFTRLQSRMNCGVALKNAMMEMEEKTRKWYLEDFQGMKSGAFARMMLLDGCFIVELLRLYTLTTYQGNDHDVQEPILKTRWVVPNICRDLLLLENQLPMFVLQTIFDITTLKSKASTTPLNELALRFFEPLRPGKDKLANNMSKYTKGEYPHLLALFQSTFMNLNDQPPQTDDQSDYDKIPGKGWVHNATTLTYAGVQFEKKSGNFLDIEYEKQKLKIPTLFIDEGTSTLFRNLIAYEQSDRSAKPYFSCLAVFLDSIVDTVEDINILRCARIIRQAKGGSQEVVNLFNSLTKGVEIDMNDCYIMQQIDKINSRCESFEAMARFRRFLAAVNFTVFNNTYMSAILTMLSIWYVIKNNSK